MGFDEFERDALFLVSRAAMHVRLLTCERPPSVARDGIVALAESIRNIPSDTGENLAGLREKRRWHHARRSPDRSPCRQTRRARRCLKFVRELEHLTVAEVIARSALSFHKPNAIMADATAAVSYLEGRRWPL
jgi:hypothetical protein